MNFPAGPINGQVTTINGIVYIYDGTKTAWKRSTSFAGNLTILGNVTSANVVTGNVYTSGGIYWSNNGAAYSSGGGGITYTSDTAPPISGNVVGDQWYDTTSDVLYEYLEDGTSSYWVDIQTSIIAANASTTLTDDIQANLGAYQLYANANIGTLFLGNAITNANLGAFQSYANTKIGTNTNSNLVVVATTSSTSNTTGALVVGGGVGVAGNVNIGGNLSVSGSYQVAGKQAVNGPAFRAYIAGSQTITSGSQQKVTFGTETFDTNNNFASSTFTPTVEGYYQLNATVRIAGSSGTGEIMLTIWKNGGEYARGTNEQGTEQGNNFYSMQVSDLAYANGTTDYFEIYIQQTSGGNRDTTAGQNISYFSGCMVRGA